MNILKSDPSECNIISKKNNIPRKNRKKGKFRKESSKSRKPKFKKSKSCKSK